MKTSVFLSNHNPLVANRYDEVVMNIYQYLNQGNLFRIYQLLDTIGGVEDRRKLEELFVKRFGFN